MTKAMHRIQRKNKFLSISFDFTLHAAVQHVYILPFFKDSRAVFLSYG